MKKSILSIWLFALVFLSVSCNDKDEEATTILPRVEATMERTFKYLGSADEDKVAYSLSLSEMQLQSDETRLELMFAPARPEGKDAVVFKILHADLPNGYIGSYKIKSLSNGKTGKTDLTYYHYFNKTSKSALFSTGNNMEGSLEIKTYNASTGLASGKFAVTIKNVTDPTSFETNPSKPRKCDIVVTGEFNNLKLKQQEE